MRTTPYAAASITAQWRIELLDPKTYAIIGSFTDATGTAHNMGVVGGTLNWSIFRAVRDDGTIDLRMPPEQAKTINWNKVRVRVGLDYLMPNPMEHNLGVYIPSNSSVEYHSGVAHVSVALHGMTTYLVQDKARVTYGLKAGTNIATAVELLLKSAGVPRYSVTPSDRKLTAAREWEPGTTYHRIINDLLDTANYYAIYTDPDGLVRADPYIAPGDREPSHQFVDDETSIYLSGWTLSADMWDNPNCITVMQKVDGNTKPIIRTVEDKDPASPFSYPNRGRWIAADPIEIDAPNVAALEAAGKRRLTEAQTASQTLAFTYGFLPLVENDAVVFSNRSANISAKYSVAKRTITIGTAKLVKAEIRRTLR